MARSIDRRAGSSDGKRPDTPEERAAHAAETIDFKGDGTLRKLGRGSRFMGQYFAHENLLRPVNRGELLGFMEMLAFARREHQWHRKLARLGWRILFLCRLTRDESLSIGPDDTWARMAHLFFRRVVEPAVLAVAEEKRKEREDQLARGRKALEDEKS